MGTNTSPWSLQDFCRAVCHHHPKTVEISLIQKGVENGLGDRDYTPMPEFLKPLKLLRSIENFQIRDATIFEVPDEIHQDENAIEFHSQMHEHPALELQLTLLAKSNDLLECGFEMYQSVLTYAQAFERQPFFKKEMALDGSQTLNEDDLGDQYGFYHNNVLSNPFKRQFPHPVESALMRAKTASNNEDLPAFKIERIQIIEYLEIQYQRILVTASKLNDFIKENKHNGGLFDADRQNGPYYGAYQDEDYSQKCATALVLLCEYAETFRRDIPLEIKANIRLYQQVYESFYTELGVRSLLQKVETAFEARSWGKFTEYFKSAVDYLDDEYLEIRKARKDLFKWDILELNQVGCDIDLELSRSDEKVKWSINEPILGPEEGYNEDSDYSADGQESDNEHNEDSDAASDEDADLDSDGDSNSDGDDNNEDVVEDDDSGENELEGEEDHEGAGSREDSQVDELATRHDSETLGVSTSMNESALELGEGSN
jgi:hypothetical protein